MRAEQEATVKRLWEASRRNRLEFLLEIIPSKVGPVDDDTTATLIRQFYAVGRLSRLVEARADDLARRLGRAIAAIEAHDAHTRGIVVLGLDAPEAELAASFETAAGLRSGEGLRGRPHDLRRGGPGLAGGAITDDEAIADMAGKYQRLCAIWDGRGRAREAVA